VKYIDSGLGLYFRESEISLVRFCSGHHDQTYYMRQPAEGRAARTGINIRTYAGTGEWIFALYWISRFQFQYASHSKYKNQDADSECSP